MALETSLNFFSVCSPRKMSVIDMEKVFLLLLFSFQNDIWTFFFFIGTH